MPDGPAWSSSTSYYAGQPETHATDSDWDGAGARAGSGHNGHNGNGRASNGHGSNGHGAAMNAPAFSPPTYRQPAYAPSEHAPSDYGQPAYGQPAYGQPAYGRPGGRTDAEFDERADDRPRSRTEARRATRQRGLPGWAALLVLLVISGIGGVIDMVSGNNIKGGFNIALVVASIVAILIVRHRDMFPIVVAPPLVYIAASAVVLYIRSGGLHNRQVVIDAAANWLVYGFPAIAGATAAVLIIGGIRLVTNK